MRRGGSWNVNDSGGGQKLHSKRRRPWLGVLLMSEMREANFPLPRQTSHRARTARSSACGDTPMLRQSGTQMSSPPPNPTLTGLYSDVMQSSSSSCVSSPASTTSCRGVWIGPSWSEWWRMQHLPSAV